MRSLFVFFLLVLFFVPAYSQLQGNAGKGNIYALIVGIANYENKDIPQLQYSNRDAEVFADYLKSKAGGSVPSENIQLLVDSAATTGAVYDAIYWLLETCKKDDLVFFYFSGHGDIENINVHKNGYFICYDSPPRNYPKNALSVDYLNTVANTLSAETLANVVLITDACHSGKLAGSSVNGNSLVAAQLRNVRDKEIRITSCAAEQLSHENEAWGDGRGVFSWYLVNGLEGLADKTRDGIVTLDEIRYYLDSSFNKDEEIKKEKIVQTPVLQGRGNFELAKVDTAVKRATARKMLLMAPRVSNDSAVAEVLPANAQEYFFLRLKDESLEIFTDSLQLNEIPVAEIPFAIIKRLKDGSKSPAQVTKLAELETTLRQSEPALNRFNGKLAVAFDKAGQEVINDYLSGDEAELERRSYYNAYHYGYDIYPIMYAVALKLIQPDNEWRNILEVKQHYFTGVYLRLQLPKTKEKAPLIAKALSEQKKALALADDAAYIYDELGRLSFLTKKDAEAEKYFRLAIKNASTWVFPHVSLMELYTAQKKYALANEEYEIAKKLQPDFQAMNVSAGVLYEKKGDLLMAEELQQKSIQQNSRHYLPFENLGYVYANTTQYLMADSFFYEAEERKKGYYFEDLRNPRFIKLPKAVISDGQVTCRIDSLNGEERNVFWYLIQGLQSYQVGDIVKAETDLKKAIALDKKNPLAQHYLGRLFYEQKRWQEGEVILKMALTNYLAPVAFSHYYDSCQQANQLLYYTCADSLIRYSHYKKEEDQYLLGMLYENWNHFDEAAAVYREIIEEDTTHGLQPYLRSCRLLEKAGRYADAEKSLLQYAFHKPSLGKNELNAFYNRMIGQFRARAEWYYKAGNFLYDLAKNSTYDFEYDKKMIDEYSGSETYVLDEPRNFRIPFINTNPDAYVLPPAYLPLPAAAKIIHPYTDGINFLGKAAELMQDDDDALADIDHKIGDLYVWQGLPQKAYAYYLEAVKLKPDDAGLRLKLIDVYSTTYHFQDAWVQLDTLYNRKELNLPNQLLLAKFCVHAGHFTRAQNLLNDAEKIQPYTQPQIIDLNARLQMLNGHPAEALVYYRKLLAIQPKDSIVMYSIARIYAKLGNTKEAWKWLKMAIDGGFNYSYVLKNDPYLDPIRNAAKWKWLDAAIKEASENSLSVTYTEYQRLLQESNNWDKFIK